jgi:hypothetical protein
MHDPRPSQKVHHSTKERRQFALVLRAEPGIDGIRALRMGLKSLLRKHGLRAVSIMEVPSAEGHEGPTQSKATPILPQSTDGPPLAPGQCVTGEPSIRSRS